MDDADAEAGAVVLLRGRAFEGRHGKFLLAQLVGKEIVSRLGTDSMLRDDGGRAVCVR